MSLAASQPATSLSHRLGLTLAGLWEAIAARMAKEKDRTFAPDGKRVAFTADGRVAVAKIGGQGETAVLTEEGTRYADLSWSPSDKADVLAMSVVKPDGKRDLCVGHPGIRGSREPSAGFWKVKRNAAAARQHAAIGELRFDQS